MDILKIDVRKWAESVSNIALDELLYKGKTLRQWADALTDPKTNADRIRAMSDEELAVALNRHCSCSSLRTWHKGMCDQSCVDCWRDWLKKETDA